MMTPSFSSLIGVILMLALIGVALDKLVLSARLEGWRRGVLDLWLKLNTPGATELAQDANQLFCDLYDWVYGKRHFSWRRVWSSGLSSLVGLVAVTLIVGYDNLIWPKFVSTLSRLLSRFGDSIDGLGWQEMLDLSPDAVEPVILALVILLIPIMLNFIPDFFSLIETRLILDVAKGRGAANILVLIVVDLALTTIIFCAGLFLLYVTMSSLPNQSPPNMEEFLRDLPRVVLSPDETLVFFLTTFITSLFWILFVLTFALVWVFHRLHPLADFIYYQVGRSNKPASAVAALLIFIVCMFYAAWFGLAWATGV